MMCAVFRSNDVLAKLESQESADAGELEFPAAEAPASHRLRFARRALSPADPYVPGTRIYRLLVSL